MRFLELLKLGILEPTYLVLPADVQERSRLENFDCADVKKFY